MQFTKEIQRLLVGVLVSLGAVAFIASYWAVVGPDRVLRRDDNRRLLEAEASIDRGRIYDRDGIALVTSEEQPDTDELVRQYNYPAMNSVLGYFSLFYGTSGAEGAYNDLLSGDTQEESLLTYFEEEVLHRPREGMDVRLTLDLAAQQALVDAVETTGCTSTASGQDPFGCAGVVLSVPDGGVLAMLSYPTYEPDMLDATWNDLIDDPANPFFNRALQASYQPGGVFQTILLMVSLIEQVDPNVPFENATDVVRTGEVAQVCAASPPAETLPLREAYIYGCPAPFAQIVSSIGIDEIEADFGLFDFDNPPELPGYVTQLLEEEISLTMTPQPTNEAIEDTTFTLNDAMGQGEVTVTPMQMAAIVASVINGGNAPMPHILNATRAPDETTWTMTRRTSRVLPITTPETVVRVQNLMRAAVIEGIAGEAAHEGYDIGGHVGLAYSGETTQAWFIGWARTAAGEGVATAIILEGSDNLDEVARIGGEVLVAAVEAKGNTTSSADEE